MQDQDEQTNDTPNVQSKPIDISKKKTQNMREYMRKYKEDNKEKFNEKMREKHDCDCGGRYTTSGKYLHNQTAKHKNYLNKN
jgi:hypothetical protein